MPLQVRQRAHDVELGAHEGEVRSGSRFSKNVSQVIFAVDETNIQSFGGDIVTNEMEVDFYVFGMSMEGGVGRKVGGPNIVTP
jgi:hypothetical protein